MIISDTHGYQDSLTGGSEDGCLPAGDLLIHCGDWAQSLNPNGGCAARLDEWLSRQPQKHKLVVRGNHDPVNATFPLSGALYVSTPRSVTFDHLAAGGSLTVACVPWTSKGPLRGGLPEGSVLVSHAPPKHVLDRATSGEAVGDESLRAAARKARVKPSLWCFGHIHEGTGAARVRFGTRADDATTLVNAANANPGMARKLVIGPVVVDFELPVSPKSISRGGGCDD